MEKEIHHPAARLRSAFTLVELLMVIAITIIVSSIAVPRFSNASNRYKLDAGARKLANDLELAQQEAMASSSSRTFTFATAGYTVTRIDSAGKTVVVRTVQLDRDPYGITKLTPAITVANSKPLKFDGFGKPNGGGTIEVVSRNDKRVVTLSSITGKATVNP